jgi:hypothetical protein
MSTVTNTPEGQRAAQALFEAMFDHTPQVDTRPPAVPATYSAAERATWRRQVA